MLAHDLTIERVLKAPRAKVWRAWSDPNHLKEWWCPKPWVTQVKAFDLRPGGAFHTNMTGPLPDGTQGQSDNPGCFLEIAPMERIVATSALGAGWRPIPSEMPMTTIFTFADHPDGTLHKAVCMHLNAEQRQQHAAMGFEHGWGTMFDQLGDYAAALPD
jgi:uncharacterized protein YndB with AHSA1/START domain